jgi:serine/threonine-protein kinase
MCISRTLGPEHPDVANSLIGLADLAFEQGRPADGIAPAERAVALRDRDDTPAELLAASRFVLARVLWEAPAGRGRDRERARAEALKARDAYRGAKGEEEKLAEVEAWLVHHGGAR